MSVNLTMKNSSVDDGEQSNSLVMADLLIHYLEQIGVEFIFGIPGGAVEPLYDAIARAERRGGLRSVLARHETGAAFMAQGYAHETGKLGVCIATTGPGATNLITGVASAYQEEVPLLVITGQTALKTFGRGAFQESTCTGVDTLGMFKHCTRYNTLISDVNQFEPKLVKALMAATGEPNGPVHLTIPPDLLQSRSSLKSPSYDLNSMLKRPSMLDMDSVESLWDIVASNKKLVIVLGEGSLEASMQILLFAEYTRTPIVTTPGAKGLIDPYHPLYHGVIGFAGHSSARDLLTNRDKDYVLVVGSSLGEWDSGGWDDKAIFNSRLIHIAASRSHLAQSPMAKMHVCGRISTIFQTFIDRIEKYANWNNVLFKHDVTEITPMLLHNIQPRFMNAFPVEKSKDNNNGVKPQQLMQELSRRFSSDTCFLADVGNSTAWGVHYLHVRNAFVGNTGWFKASIQFGSMGWAIGNAIGIALGNRHKTVVCITGDGSLLMSAQELTVAVAEKLNIIFVVLNDGALGMVKHGQHLTGAESIAFELPPVDFSAMAQAMGANGYQVKSLDDLVSLDMEAICQRGEPIVLDVHINREEVPPMGARVKVLEEQV